MQFVIPGCAPEPQARMSSKMVHLTYAALEDGELNFDSLLTSARTWGLSRQGLLEYTIGHELHVSPADPRRAHHFHAYFKFGKKIEARDRFRSTLFDLHGNSGRLLHPEIQSVGCHPSDRERVIRYDMKDGDYVGELITPLIDDPRREQQEQEEQSDDVEDDESNTEIDKVPRWASMLNKASNVNEGMQTLAEKVPHVYYLHGSRIKPMLMASCSHSMTSIFRHSP